MKITVKFSPQTIPISIDSHPLPEGNFSRIRHDCEAMDGKFRIGMPAVFPLYRSQYCPLTEKWQWFWFRQLIHSYTGFKHWDEKRLSRTELDILKGKWRSLTKSSEAFTNFKGTNENKDYITPNNLTEIPGQEPLICTGNVVKVLGDPINLSGEKKTPIETLDGNVPPPSIEKVNRITTPHIIFCATNNAANKSDPKNWVPIRLSDGRCVVDPFPQFENFAYKDVLVPLRTNGKEASTYQRDGVSYAVNYIRTSRLESVQSLPTPYVR